MNTIMLFRCTSKKYADVFLKHGNVRFGKPNEWIQAWESDGEGRGDLLEGAFASIKEYDERAVNFYESIRPNVKQKKVDEYIFFQSEDVLNLPTLCWFGVNDNMFNEQCKGEDGKLYPSGKITKDYFNDFAKGLTKEESKKLSDDKRPALIMIKNPHEFFERVKKFFYNIGVNKDEIIIAPIKYINKKEQFFVADRMPNELLAKDNSYSYQSEIRIIIKTNNLGVNDFLKKSNGIVNIGSMEDIADVQEYYFDDFVMQRRGNSFLFVLPEPKITAFQDLTKEELLGIIGQIVNDTLPEPLKNEDEKQDCLKTLEKILNEKYNIYIKWETLKKH